MRKTNIEKAIGSKIDRWLASITDEQLRSDLRGGIIVTGGCIVSMLTHEEVSDYDVYFRTKDLAKRVAQYYCAQFNEEHKGHTNKLGKVATAWVLDGVDVEAWKAGRKTLNQFCVGYEGAGVGAIPSGMVSNTPADRIKIMVNSDGIAEDTEAKDNALDASVDAYIEAIQDADELPASSLEGEQEKPKYRPIFLSTNAVTLSDKIQLVVRFYGEPEEIHKNYDFLHCTCYWTSWTKQVVWTTEALDCIINKELFYMGSKYPICSVIRTRKFMKRGWTINAGQYLKMAFQISELDLTNIDTLEDQLVGVDSLYFMAAIDQLRKLSAEKAAAGESFKFDSTYLATIVDKVFK